MSKTRPRLGLASGASHAAADHEPGRRRLALNADGGRDRPGRLPGEQRRARVNLLRDRVPAGPGTGCPGYVRRFDAWAASYDRSPLQAVLYRPVHDVVLRYARQHVPHPAMILDVGCGTGRLSARLASAYDRARVVGIDASTGMIQNAAATTVPRRSRFAAAMAERLPFADAVFDLVVVTLSVSHWGDRAAGMAQISRVMAPGGTLVAAGACPAPPFPSMTRRARRSRLGLPDELPALVGACGLRVERVEPIPSVAAIADTVMVAARATAGAAATGPVRRGTTAVRSASGP